MEEDKKRVRRNNIFLLLTLLVFALIVRYIYGQGPAVSAFRAWIPLSGKVIVIDPGHGGIDGGASFNNVLEKKYESGSILKA
jgi:N-acetylmuramoyl-L-alanine amidase